MNKEVYDEFNQPVYRQQLPTGLSLQMIPMSGYHKTYAIFTTDFGSIDNHFVPYGKKNAIQVPDGIAHFLEHKMFEKADHDAFDLFGKLGADSNAAPRSPPTSSRFPTTERGRESLKV